VVNFNASHARENPMAGTLDEIFRVRTNGNGYVQQEWEHILLQRELSQLVAEGRVREEAYPLRKNAKYPEQWVTRRFRDLETGGLYEYTGPWERGGPRFYKLGSV
jgi:hypothetical protein